MQTQHLNTRSAFVRSAYTRLAGHEVVQNKWTLREAVLGLIRSVLYYQPHLQYGLRHSTEWYLAKRNDIRPR